MICKIIREELKKRNFKITYDKEDEKSCILNFVHEPSFKRIEREYGKDEAIAISVSSIHVDKEKDAIEANLISPLKSFCELYLDYCCDKGTNICRIHIDPEAPMRIGLEVKPISTKNVNKLKEALDDFYNCITT